MDKDKPKLEALKALDITVTTKFVRKNKLAGASVSKAQLSPVGMPYFQDTSRTCLKFSRRCLSTHASFIIVKRCGKDSLVPLLLELLQFLLLEACWLAELNYDLVGGKLGVSVGHAGDLA